MSEISPVLRTIEGGGLAFYCPACSATHSVWVGEGPGPRWSWNQSAEAPTFQPSVRVGGVVPWTDEQYAEAAAAEARGEPRPAPEPRNCHFFVREGKIEYLSDCTHALAGHTVQMVPRQEWYKRT